jgi:hypothetical protein
LLTHSSVIGFIQYPPALGYLPHKAIFDVQTLLYLPFRAHQQIQGEYADFVNQIIENDSRLVKRTALKRHDNQQVNVRFVVRLAVGLGAEKHYLVGPEFLRYRLADQADMFASHRPIQFWRFDNKGFNGGLSAFHGDSFSLTT